MEDSKLYWQVYDKSGLVYYTDDKDRLLTTPFEVDKLHSFIYRNYPGVNTESYLDDNWDEVCLNYWNEVISKLPFTEYKSKNTPQQTKEKV